MYEVFIKQGFTLPSTYN